MNIYVIIETYYVHKDVLSYRLTMDTRGDKWVNDIFGTIEPNKIYVKHIKADCLGMQWHGVIKVNKDLTESEIEQAFIKLNAVMLKKIKQHYKQLHNDKS